MAGLFDTLKEKMRDSFARNKDEDYDDYEDYNDYSDFDQYDDGIDSDIVYSDEEDDSDYITTHSSDSTARQRERVARPRSRPSRGESERTRLSGRNDSVEISTTVKYNIRFYEPSALTSLEQMAQSLIDKNAILVNLEKMTRTEKRRVLDFLNGVVFACQCNYKKINESTYLITPRSVTIESTELISELENKGVFLK
ncbi:MAG: cell division protein SepF [Oscillospiraceae bacterium]|jgi:FtsZ-interacting cell division protein YlmF|nr:cell division protein SepF [Oscillospiraceae bacterium]